jgi:hypothetical protein
MYNIWMSNLVVRKVAFKRLNQRNLQLSPSEAKRVAWRRERRLLDAWRLSDIFGRRRHWTLFLAGWFRLTFLKSVLFSKNCWRFRLLTPVSRRDHLVSIARYFMCWGTCTILTRKCEAEGPTIRGTHKHRVTWAHDKSHLSALWLHSQQYASELPTVALL